jgi:hypothetical protein
MSARDELLSESSLQRHPEGRELAPWFHDRDAEVPYSIRRSKRAKSISLSVTPVEGLVVTIPERLALKHVPGIIEERRDWIHDAFTRLADVRALYVERSKEPLLPSVIDLRALGERRWVIYAPDENRRLSVREQGPYRIVVSGNYSAQSAQLALRRWLAARTKADIIPWLFELAASRQLTATGTSVRNQKTRWASCSASGKMSINFNLLFLPRRLVRLVLVHELCHRVEMSHSQRFWQLLENEEPDMRALNEELDQAWQLIPSWAHE